MRIWRLKWYPADRGGCLVFTLLSSWRSSAVHACTLPRSPGKICWWATCRAQECLPRLFLGPRRGSSLPRCAWPFPLSFCHFPRDWSGSNTPTRWSICTPFYLSQAGEYLPLSCLPILGHIPPLPSRNIPFLLWVQVFTKDRESPRL